LRCAVYHIVARITCKSGKLRFAELILL